MKRLRTLVSVLTVLALPGCGSAFSDVETLDDYWPLYAESREWSLTDSRDRMARMPKTLMTVLIKKSGPDQVDLWFSNKPGQAAGTSNVERYDYCANSGGMPWLFLEEYIDVKDGEVTAHHPVKATRIWFTPEKGETQHMIADGTYAKCGSKGQPYLAWNLEHDKYRIQVWGVLTENPKWKWYWDATVSKPAPVTNECIHPPQTVRALKVQEAWWDNFDVATGKWGMGSGEIGGDGLPSGNHIGYGRTVWHAKGRMPYFLTGLPDGKSVNWCTNVVKPAMPGAN